MEKDKLDFLYHMLMETILINQDCITGLIPESKSSNHAIVRDNIYASISIWGLSISYKKLSDDEPEKARAYELEKISVRIMRGILKCFMLQSDKVERFKHTQSHLDALHAKFNVANFRPVVGDEEWGHLQIDCVSLYILTIAQMTSYGIKMIWTLEEVNLIQNIVFCIESAYRIPDFGVWGRGDRTNKGILELNSSSIGMAKSALEAIGELDLFGANYKGLSTIHVIPDEYQQCNIVLHNVLPRESNSKEIDAGLLGIISYPSFSVDNQDLINKTRNTILDKLLGSYGCKRFPRDGYRSAREDPSRVYYESWELHNFEGIEPEWPIFFAYLTISAVYSKEDDYAKTCIEQLESIMIEQESTNKKYSSFPIMMELFTLEKHDVEAELERPHSQSRIHQGQFPHVWGQSMYILAKLLQSGFILPGEIDPIGRRMITEPKPDLVVQVVILAENDRIKNRLAEYDLKVQTFSEAYEETNIRIYPAKVLSYLYKQLGVCQKLGLTGRSNNEIGILTTSRFYKVAKYTLAFTPQFTDYHSFYLSLDVNFIMNYYQNYIAFLKRAWNSPGRPLLLIPAYDWFFQRGNSPLTPSLVTTLKKIKSGYLNGTRVQLGTLNVFQETSCHAHLSFLKTSDILDEASQFSFYHQKTEAISPRISMTSTNHESNSINEKYQRFSFRRKSTALAKAITLDLRNKRDEVNNEKLMLPKTSSGSVPKSTTLNTWKNISKCQDILREEVKPDNFIDRFVDMSADQLVQMLRETECIAEQSEILEKLKSLRGLDWDTNIVENQKATVRNLLEEVYEHAGRDLQWFLLRYTACLLEKQSGLLAKSLTDLLVMQKQVTVGLPPEPDEKIITEPLPPHEIAKVINEACGDDCLLGIVTQEIIVYLAMISRTHPDLFRQMLRIRIGLIIKMMCSELARTMRKSVHSSMFYLFSMSPYNMKQFLFNLIAGNEIDKPKNVSKVSTSSVPVNNNSMTRMNSSTNSSDERKTPSSLNSSRNIWLRRRKTDGALNRVPPGFFFKIHGLLERVDGLTLHDKTIYRSLTTEMTKEENKFALRIESFMNVVPTPEYRQLVIEALMVLGQMVNQDIHKYVTLNRIVNVEELVAKANLIFLRDQLENCGVATKCCATIEKINEKSSNLHLQGLFSCGPHEICQEFFNTAPAGRFGTMSYMVRALTDFIRDSMQRRNDKLVINCSVQ